MFRTGFFTIIVAYVEDGSFHSLHHREISKEEAEVDK